MKDLDEVSKWLETLTYQISHFFSEHGYIREIPDDDTLNVIKTISLLKISMVLEEMNALKMLEEDVIPQRDIFLPDEPPKWVQNFMDKFTKVQ